MIGGNTEQDWMLLEDGVEIQFPIPDEDNNEIPYVYQTGDYWLIPPRAMWNGQENQMLRIRSPHKEWNIIMRHSGTLLSMRAV